MKFREGFTGPHEGGRIGIGAHDIAQAGSGYDLLQPKAQRRDHARRAWNSNVRLSGPVQPGGAQSLMHGRRSMITALFCLKLSKIRVARAICSGHIIAHNRAAPALMADQLQFFDSFAYLRLGGIVSCFGSIVLLVGNNAVFIQVFLPGQFRLVPKRFCSRAVGDRICGSYFLLARAGKQFTKPGYRVKMIVFTWHTSQF